MRVRDPFGAVTLLWLLATLSVNDRISTAFDGDILIGLLRDHGGG